MAPPEPNFTTEGDLTGKVCVVTGATSGIGRATALQLARLGATVGLVGRNSERGQAVRAQVAGDGDNDRAELFLADLSVQRDVRRLAASILERFPAVHALVNVAGVDVGQREVTEDGMELTFAVNHLAPFLLTSLLINRLRESAPARVVTVSSGAHHTGRIDFDDLQGERHFRGQRAYNQSKLANVLFTRELARRLADTGVTANAVDPGWVKGTGLGRTASLSLKLMGLVMTPFMVDAEKGAETVVWATASSAVEGQTGMYFAKCKAQSPSKRAQDPNLARRLWDVSEELTAQGPGQAASA